MMSYAYIKFKVISKLLFIISHKSYVDSNFEPWKSKKTELEKDFFKLMNKFAFGETIENFQRHRNIRPVNNNKKRNYLVSKPSCDFKKNGFKGKNSFGDDKKNPT